ncbi:MAG TPA: T9SS type A sorting domain-containing protein, partial [Terriglobia bacterium]|nr:T9SS type A sorting domain-containing protein [Terriglobia bacterium]
PVFGIPDSLFVDVKSDGRNHRLYYRFEDGNGNFFNGIGKKYLNDSVAFDAVNAPLTGMSPLSGVTQETYPLTLERMEIQLAGVRTQGTVNAGTIYVDNLRLKYPGTATGVVSLSGGPVRFQLEQNFPNPFNPTTAITYELPLTTHVSLTVYDLLGREVATLVRGRMNAGVHRVTFDGSRLSSGVYFYRIRAGEHTETKKLLLVR